MICVAAVDMLGVCGFDTSLLCTFFLSFRLVQVIGVIDVVFFSLSFYFFHYKMQIEGWIEGSVIRAPFFSARGTVIASHSVLYFQ